MTGITRKIQAIINGETTPGPLLGGLLKILSMLYGIVVSIRGSLYDYGIFRTRKLPCGVISIGNLTVGGTGKTPMTIYLAQLLKDCGYQPAVISRGYRGQAENKGAIVSDRRNIISGPDVAGDEPFMMANRLKGIPVLVGADRFEIGMKAVQQFSPDVIVFDDAFQHRRLMRDLNIVLVDDKSFFGNQCLLPRGMLREPVSGISRGDVFVLTRCDHHTGSRSFSRLAEMAPGKPIFKAFHTPYVCGIFNGEHRSAPGCPTMDASENFEFLKTSKVFVFSGIAKNEEFTATVEKLAGEVLGAVGFNDHHQYTESDLQMIAGRAQNSFAEFLVTTEKDYVKIAGKLQSAMPIVVIGIGISFKQDEKRFTEFIKDKAAHILH